MEGGQSAFRVDAGSCGLVGDSSVGAFSPVVALASYGTRDYKAMTSVLQANNAFGDLISRGQYLIFPPLIGPIVLSEC